MSTVRTVYLIRHGRAAAGWDSDPDPDLDEVGRAQAAAVATTLSGLGITRIVASPLQRCRSTAAALAGLLDHEVHIEPAVAEIPSPHGVDMADRVVWLREAMKGSWADLDDRYTTYRDAVVDAVGRSSDGTAIFSHFVAINAVIGACLGDDGLVIRSLDNCSVTTIAIGDDGLRLVEGGREADTLIR